MTDSKEKARIRVSPKMRIEIKLNLVCRPCQQLPKQKAKFEKGKKIKGIFWRVSFFLEGRGTFKKTHLEEEKEIPGLPSGPRTVSKRNLSKIE